MSYKSPDTVSYIPGLMRLALQGESGSGKSTSALTFPNPIVADFDHKLPCVCDTIPFWNPEFVYKLCPKKGTLPANTKSAFKKWLETNYALYTLDQTFILDSWTMLQGAFDRQTDLEPSYTKGTITKAPEIDKWAFWKEKIQYSRNICELLQSMKCNVIVIFHEQREKDDEGRWLGKYRPLMAGQFCDILPTYFTDWYRQIVVETRDSAGKGTGDYSYKWQLKTDSVAACNTSFVTAKRFCDASYDALQIVNKQQNKGTQ